MGPAKVVSEKKGGQEGDGGAGDAKKPMRNDGGEHDHASKKPKTGPVRQYARSRKEQKELKQHRKAESNPNYEMVAQLKQLWEKARLKQLPVDNRRKYIVQMMDLARGKIPQVVFQHDSTRIIQSIFKYGNAEQRQEIFNELKDHIVRMCQTKYASYTVNAFLRHGTKQMRDHIIEQFRGRVRKLIRQRLPSIVLATAFVDYASSRQKAALVQEFYGPHFVLFNTNGRKTLAEFLAAHPDKRNFVMSRMRDTLVPLMEKGICAHHIVHVVLLDYLRHADEKDRDEMIDMIKELVVEMLHTREGGQLTLFVLKHTSAKDRKTILRSFKPYIDKIAVEEFGHVVLLGAFDVVDDTVLLRKQIVQPLTSAIDTVAMDPHGRKVLLYLTAHRSPVYFTPQTLRLLRDLDDNPHSKKDASVRRQELLTMVSPTLVALVTDHADKLMRQGQASLLVVETLTHCKGDKSPAYNAVAAEAVAEENPLYEHPSGHKMLKKLAHIYDPDTPGSFAKTLMQRIDAANKVEAMLACNRGAFVLLSLVESGEDCKTLVAELRSLVPQLNNSDGGQLSPGVKLLLKALEEVRNGRHPEGKLAQIKAEEQGDDEEDESDDEEEDDEEEDESEDDDEEEEEEENEDGEGEDESEDEEGEDESEDEEDDNADEKEAEPATASNGSAMDTGKDAKTPKSFKKGKTSTPSPAQTTPKSSKKSKTPTPSTGKDATPKSSKKGKTPGRSTAQTPMSVRRRRTREVTPPPMNPNDLSPLQTRSSRRRSAARRIAVRK